MAHLAILRWGRVWENGLGRNVVRGFVSKRTIACRWLNEGIFLELIVEPESRESASVIEIAFTDADSESVSFAGKICWINSEPRGKKAEFSMVS